MVEINTKLMRAAIAVFEAGTFSKAAIVLRIGQSGLTKQIAALENALGFLVFTREGKRNIRFQLGRYFWLKRDSLSSITSARFVFPVQQSSKLKLSFTLASLPTQIRTL